MRTIEEIEARMAEIPGELENPEADLDALHEEVRQLKAEKEELRKAADDAEKRRKLIAEGLGEVVETHDEEDHKMTELELRSSKEYLEAWAGYIRTEDDKEVRALLKTVNASGTLPVPTIVDEIVRHAWEEDEILSRCTKSFVKGNRQVAFEQSADGAYVHTEGTTAPTEESLAIGVVTMNPAMIKKWIHLTDEDVIIGLGNGEAFVRYVYEELIHQINKKLAGLVVTDITGLSTSNGSTAPGAARITAAPSLTVIAEAYANLSDEATDPVIIMNKLTYANFMAAFSAGNFAIDPFMGFKVLYNNTLPAYDTATGGTDDYAIVGDLSAEVLNFPDGEGVKIIWDNLSEAEADLVKVVGRQYVAHAVVAPFAFTRIKKPSAATE